MPRKIEKRSKNTYRLSVCQGYDRYGRQIIKYKTIKASSDREAERQYTLFAAKVLNGGISHTGKCKVYEFAKQWYELYCKKELAPKTQESYKNHLEKRILPALGHMDIRQLKPAHILQFLNGLKESRKRFDSQGGSISDQTIKYCFRVLSSMLQDAVEWQVIDINPCTKVKRPRSKRSKVKLPSEGEIKHMLAELNEEPLKYRTIILLAIDTGLRRGELVGLKWQDIDLEEKKLAVRRSNQAIAGRGTFSKSPKTEESERCITLSDSSVQLLKRYHAWQLRQKMRLANQWHDEDWVFAAWNGAAMYPGTPSLWFSRFLKRKGLPHMSFHSLRHLSATVLIAQGVPLKNVSSRLGHADIRTTANIYADTLQSIDKMAADKMDNFLKKAQNI